MSAGLLWLLSMLLSKFMERRACVLIKCWLRCKWMRTRGCLYACVRVCWGMRLGVWADEG